MKRRSIRNQAMIGPALTLIMVLLAACAPATPAAVPTVVDTPLVNTQAPTQVSEEVATDTIIAATEMPTPIRVATSRGPDLEATDPTTVNLASGQLQLVEFFRFT